MTSNDQAWAAVANALDEGFTLAPGTGGPDRHTTWLTTINADGSPHVTAVGAIWVDGAFWFQTGEGTRKARNVARDPRCAVSLSTNDFDLVVEGTAERVEDADALARAVAVWNAGGWPCEVDPSGTGVTAPFNAPGVGPPPWSVYRVTARAATSMSTAQPGGMTRFAF